MSRVIGRTQCENCKDTGCDNKVLYDDGSSYCFACQKGSNSSMHNAPKNKSKVTPLVETGAFQDIDSRGISKKTCEFFNYQVGSFTGYIKNEHVRDKKVHIANYCDEFGTVVAQKIRGAGKKFTIRGDAQAMVLYGMWKYQPNEKVFVTVCEGEVDALSIAEAQGTRFPVVSIPTGAGSAKKSLSKHLEWLQGFKHVVLAFDNDEDGQKAAKDCVDLFEPGKVRVAKWPMKDANEMLVAGRGKEIVDVLFQSQEVRPDKLCSSVDLLDRILTKPEIGVEWPWPALTECTSGLLPNQLILVGAAPSIGKSELVKDIILDMAANKGVKCGVFSFEQDAADTLRRLIGGMIGVPLHLPGDWWDEDVIREKALELDNKVHIYDNWGGAKLEDIVPKMRYLAKAYGTKLFVIDHLTALAAKMDGDTVKGIDKAMELLASLKQELKCSIILVSHLARDKQKGGTELSWGSGRRPVLENFRGSGAIEAWADVVLGLSRNADSDDIIEKQILNIECLKARLNGSKRGFRFSLMYNDQTGRLMSMGDSTCTMSKEL